jgi:hypothetical protein
MSRPCVSLWTGWLAEANLLQGRTADATWHAERSLQLAVERKESAYQAFAHRIVGEVTARREPSESAKAEEHFRHAMAMAEEREMRPLIARCHLNLAQLHRRTGNRDLVQSHLTTTESMLRDVAMAYWLDQLQSGTREAGR